MSTLANVFESEWDDVLLETARECLETPPADLGPVLWRVWLAGAYAAKSGASAAGNPHRCEPEAGLWLEGFHAQLARRFRRQRSSLSGAA